jgi:hypothetical protein
MPVLFTKRLHVFELSRLFVRRSVRRLREKNIRGKVTESLCVANARVALIQPIAQQVCIFVKITKAMNCAILGLYVKGFGFLRRVEDQLFLKETAIAFTTVLCISVASGGTEGGQMPHACPDPTHTNLANPGRTIFEG